MSTLADTNVISELMRSSPNFGVLDWARVTGKITISAITIHEIAFGLKWKPDPHRQLWFEDFLARRCQVLPVTAEIAMRSGTLRGALQTRGDIRSHPDMLIAATAQAHGLTVVTRNLRDFEGCGLDLLNPFTDDPPRKDNPSPG